MTDFGAIDDFLQNEKSQKIFEFMIYFSRFEYALKEIWRYSNEDYSVKWRLLQTDFRDDFNQEFLEKYQDKEIIKNPPKKIPNTESWWEIEKKNVILYIRTIRNNLFHGQKNDFLHLQFDGRDYILITDALEILKEILKYFKESNNDDFKKIYENFIRF